MLRLHRHVHGMPDRATWKRAAWRRLSQVLGVLTVGCFLQAEAASVPMGADSLASAGGRMFLGEASLKGTVAGHGEPLPARLASCANCHLGGPGSGKSFAPALDRTTMTEPMGRRGGPPSAFSLVSFCRLLRTGVDPAYVLVTRQMPRYSLSDEQCLGLWRYLTEASHERGDK